MNRKRIHRIVEYLKTVEFYHDTYDLADESTQGVLCAYGIYDIFSPEELRILQNELHALAEQNEFREAAFLAGADALGQMDTAERETPLCVVAE